MFGLSGYGPARILGSYFAIIIVYAPYVLSFLRLAQVEKMVIVA